ncbi:excinuclease ABC subunit UvrB [Candidatus Falkowbacteria bacterium]|nr:excinuclease ABC subunit UvrB [Candidatus Falkowbacteria bacterium]
MNFQLTANFKPTGDQPQAIATLVNGLRQNYRQQTLLGVTGSGKTFTVANVIADIQKPTLIISPNKTLAAQLHKEFKAFFPNNAVHYFVSYYDYYQPEAYLPPTDTYIEKEATINENIDRLRHAATQALMTRDDVIIVASVSCIYGLGEKLDYQLSSQSLTQGEAINRQTIIKKLLEMQYQRQDIACRRGQFRVAGETIDIYLATGEAIVRIDLFDDLINAIYLWPIDPEKEKARPASLLDLAVSAAQKLTEITILPAKHFMTPSDRMTEALIAIRQELTERIAQLKKENKLLEAERLERKTNYDLEMLEQVGYCNGIENYSRHLSGRPAGSPPATLLDFFPQDFLTIIDESHVAVPQINGMFAGDRARKEVLVDFGFRLPSAMDNRPLSFTEFNQKIGPIIYTSATPGRYELAKSQQIVEQVIRPTGLLDPQIEVRPSHGQIADVITECQKRSTLQERVLITTLTKRMAEELADYLTESGLKTSYLHSDIDTLERINILQDLRGGRYDVLVGVNLLREGLDLPEVSLIIILDADMSGFLRNETSLIQTIGRAARHINGQVIMYADRITPAMDYAIKETRRRRQLQDKYNKKHQIIPAGIVNANWSNLE